MNAIVELIGWAVLAGGTMFLLVALVLAVILGLVSKSLYWIIRGIWAVHLENRRKLGIK